MHQDRQETAKAAGIKKLRTLSQRNWSGSGPQGTEIPVSFRDSLLYASPYAGSYYGAYAASPYYSAAYYPSAYAHSAYGAYGSAYGAYGHSAYGAAYGYGAYGLGYGYGRGCYY